MSHTKHKANNTLKAQNLRSEHIRFHFKDFFTLPVNYKLQLSDIINYNCLISNNLTLITITSNVHINDVRAMLTLTHKKLK